MGRKWGRTQRHKGKRRSKTRKFIPPGDHSFAHAVPKSQRTKDNEWWRPLYPTITPYTWQKIEMPDLRTLHKLIGAPASEIARGGTYYTDNQNRTIKSVHSGLEPLEWRVKTFQLSDGTYTTDSYQAHLDHVRSMARAQQQAKEEGL